MKFSQIVGIATIAVSSLLVSANRASAIIYSFSNAVPNPNDPLSVSGFFDIDDTLGTNPGIVEFGTELVDWSLEISSSTSGVPSTTLIPGNSAINLSSLGGVTVSSSQLDFSGANNQSLCITNSGFCTTTSISERAYFFLNNNSLSSFRLDLGAEPNSNFQNNTYASGSFANFPQQINNSTAVPFEFSPTLGLVLAGSLFGLARYRKRQVNIDS